jgi:uncharacterized membrane protein YphA (DoxX/SURF4 family)
VAAAHRRALGWLAPLFARITVGWVFLWSGWGKLHNLPLVIENFIGWGVPCRMCWRHSSPALNSSVACFRSSDC